MKIGIISDSHDKARPVQLAVTILVDRKVDAIAHCGDFGSSDIPEPLKHLDIPVYAVAGNCDAMHIDALNASAEKVGLNFQPIINTIPLGGGKSLAMTHEHDRAAITKLIANNDYPYVCHGHVHCLRDEIIHATRVICPGGLGAHKQW